jgi:glycosyltransferase involved in cell wall biosynthesis
VTLVHWQARGLHSQMTGIENFIVAFADNLFNSDVVSPTQLTASVDVDSQLREELSSRGVAVGRRPGPVTIRHSFARDYLPTRCQFSIHSIFDWGPFHDRGMSAKGRFAWASAMAYGVMRTQNVHYLNRTLPDARPGFLPSRAHLICAPGLDQFPSSQLRSSEGYGLFVGTSVPRKRLDYVIRYANASKRLVRAVGAGTETIRTEYCHGLGRVSEEELDSFYAGADYLLLLSEYEGFGIPVLEAAARGLHSVVSTEVAEILPPELWEYVHAAEAKDAGAVAVAAESATRARGSSYFYIDMWLPLREWYSERLLKRPELSQR